VSFRGLERKWEFGDGVFTNSENMVILGYNLAALKAFTVVRGKEEDAVGASSNRG
jgi:hypothetical protein